LSEHQTVLKRRIDPVLAQIMLSGREKSRTSAQYFDGSARWHDHDPAASWVSQPLGCLAWLDVRQANKPAWGDARDGGKRWAAWAASLRSEWGSKFVDHHGIFDAG
jgi:hypothetical protein